MTTLRLRALVSAGAIFAGALAGCAHAPVPAAIDVGDHAGESAASTIRFDNQGREHVHVYLVGEKREWLLGRVEPGATAMLRIPDAALADTDEFVQVAVLAGGRMTLDAAHDSRAKLSISQPASRLMSQRWRYVQGQLTPLWVRGRYAVAGGG